VPDSGPQAWLSLELGGVRKRLFKTNKSRHLWPTPVILATWEIEIVMGNSRHTGL
jgi:hypothetical protein